MTRILEPQKFLELVENVVEKAEEKGDVFVMGDHVGEITVKEKELEDTDVQVIDAELGFDANIFKGDNKDISQLSKSKSIFTKFVGISKDRLSEEGLEVVQNVSEGDEE